MKWLKKSINSSTDQTKGSIASGAELKNTHVHDVLCLLPRELESTSTRTRGVCASCSARLREGAMDDTNERATTSQETAFDGNHE